MTNLNFKIAILCLLFAISCKPSETSKKDLPKNDLMMKAKQLGIEKLGADCRFEASPDSLYLLCLNETADAPIPMATKGAEQHQQGKGGTRIHWMVVSISDPPKAIAEEVLASGKVWWEKGHLLMVEQRLGVRTDAPLIKTFDPSRNQWGTPGAEQD